MDIQFYLDDHENIRAMAEEDHENIQISSTNKPHQTENPYITQPNSSSTDTVTNHPNMNTEIIDTETINDFDNADTYNEDIENETFDTEEIQSENMEVDTDIMDETDNQNTDLFGTIANAETMIVNTLEEISEEFGRDTTKQIVLNACKTANIALFEPKTRNFQQVLLVNIEELKSRIQSFSKATVDLNIHLSGQNTVNDCLILVQKINSLHTTNHVAQVAIFVFFCRLSAIIKKAENTTTAKEFNKNLQEALEIKKSQTYSKFKRKCHRVAQLYKILGPGGGAAMGMYVKIHTLENAGNDDWRTLMKELQTMNELITFCKTIITNAQGMPILPRPNSDPGPSHNTPYSPIA